MPCHPRGGTWWPKKSQMIQPYSVQCRLVNVMICYGKWICIPVKDSWSTDHMTSIIYHSCSDFILKNACFPVHRFDCVWLCSFMFSKRFLFLIDSHIYKFGKCAWKQWQSKTPQQSRTRRFENIWFHEKKTCCRSVESQGKLESWEGNAAEPWHSTLRSETIETFRWTLSFEIVCGCMWLSQSWTVHVDSKCTTLSQFGAPENGAQASQIAFGCIGCGRN